MTQDCQKIFYQAIQSIHAFDLEKCCALYEVSVTDFLVWVNKDRLHYAKWQEIQETRASELKVQAQKIKKYDGT